MRVQKRVALLIRTAELDDFEAFELFACAAVLGRLASLNSIQWLGEICAVIGIRRVLSSAGEGGSVQLP